MRAGQFLLGLVLFGVAAGQVGFVLGLHVVQAATHAGAAPGPWSRAFLSGALGLFAGAALLLDSWRPARPRRRLAMGLRRALIKRLLAVGDGLEDEATPGPEPEAPVE